MTRLRAGDQSGVAAAEEEDEAGEERAKDDPGELVPVKEGESPEHGVAAGVKAGEKQGEVGQEQKEVAWVQAAAGFWGHWCSWAGDDHKSSLAGGLVHREWIERGGKFKQTLLPGRQAKDAENSALVDDADLGVRAIVKAGALVEFISLHKECFNGFVCGDRGILFRHLPAGAVEMFDNGAVEMALPSFCAGILRKGFFSYGVQAGELPVCISDRLYALLGGQIEAVAQVDCSADDGWSFNFAPGQAGPLICPEGVVLPEINAGAEPIVGFFTRYKLRTAQKKLGGLGAASVISEDDVRQSRDTPALIRHSHRSIHLFETRR